MSKVLPLFAVAGAAAAAAASSSSPTSPQGFHVSWSENATTLLTWANVGSVSEHGGSPRCLLSFAADAAAAAAAVAAAAAAQQPPQRAAEWTHEVAARSRTYSDKCDAPQCTAWKGWVRTAEVPAATAEAAAAAKALVYTCGDDDNGFSSVRAAKLRSADAGAALDSGVEMSFIVLADVGAGPDAKPIADYFEHNAQGLQDALNASFALVLGDVAYTKGVQSVWDDFFAMWDAPLFSSTPTLFSPGNHDGDWLFGNNYEYPQSSWVGGGESGTAYAARLPGPGAAVEWPSHHPNVPATNSTSFWWSVAVGGVRVIATSGVHAFEEGSAQYAWFERELARAAEPAERARNPWLVVTNHFPLYCTIDDCFCGNYTKAARARECQPGRDGKFLPGILEINAVRMKEALEPLLLRHNVDLFLAGHEHCYERTVPVADFVVASKNRRYGPGAVFTNPGAPLHVMAGTGGGGPDTKWRQKQGFDWTSVRSDGSYTDTHPFGFVRLNVSADRTTLSGQYTTVSGTAPPVLRDSFSIVKKV